MFNIQNRNKTLSDLKNEFLHPDPEFSPIPFWFWNDALEEGEISKQIRSFLDKGIMGFVIHPRMGLPQEIQYLSDRFMAMVKFAVSEADRYGMKVILYDEGMYPSGSAHGMVVAGNPEYATRGLRMVEAEWTTGELRTPELSDGENIIAVIGVEKTGPQAIRPGSAVGLEFYDGFISSYPPTTGDWRVLFFIETFSRGTIRGIHFGEDDGEPAAPPSADLLNPEAVSEFIRLTHERYYSVLHQYFGRTIIAFFTDEPDLLGRCARSGLKPWTKGFLTDFIAQGNNCLDLPALWFDVGEDTEVKRQNYRRGIIKRLENSYYRQLALWCQDHGVALTGHPSESEAIGLLKYFRIPGQDLVWRWVAPEDDKGLEGPHSTIGKCSSDAARHLGKRRNANECLGCCGPSGIPWAFSMDDQKWYLDWLLVRGVNLIIPHAFYYSLTGERINERPPDVGPNNIWWPYYGVISDYIKRLCWLMTDSYNVTPIAVLCKDNYLPWEIVKPLYQNQIEFNYLEDNLLLSDECRIDNGTILIQHQKYQLLIVDNPGMLSDELNARLQEFVNGGGKVMVYHSGSKYVLPGKFYRVTSIEEIVDTVTNLVGRDLLLDPAAEHLRVSHIVKDGYHFYLLVNEGEDLIQGDLQLHLTGTVEIWDAWFGEIRESVWNNSGSGQRRIPISLQRRESLIICIDPTGIDRQTEKSTESPVSMVELELTGDWTLQCALLGLSRQLLLESWTNWPGMEYFSGTVVYETTFELMNLPDRIELDLGVVAEIVQIELNGRNAGFKLWAPYIFDIAPWVVKGVNRLRVQITNSLANRIHRVKLESGLIGPVKLRLVKDDL